MLHKALTGLVAAGALALAPAASANHEVADPALGYLIVGVVLGTALADLSYDRPEFHRHSLHRHYHPAPRFPRRAWYRDERGHGHDHGRHRDGRRHWD